MNARQRRTKRRATERRFPGMLFAARAPAWAKTTVEEIVANCRRLLGYGPMSDVVADYEIRSRFMTPRVPLVHMVQPI